MGENHFAALPTALYGVVLLLAAIAYFVLARAIIASEGPRSRLADAIYVGVAAMWLVPDRRIERRGGT